MKILSQFLPMPARDSLSSATTLRNRSDMTALERFANERTTGERLAALQGSDEDDQEPRSIIIGDTEHVFTPSKPWDDLHEDAMQVGVITGAAGYKGGLPGMLVGFGAGAGGTYATSLEHEARDAWRGPDDPTGFERQWGLDRPLVSAPIVDGSTTTQVYEGGSTAVTTRRDDGSTMVVVSRPDTTAASGPRSAVETEIAADGTITSVRPGEFSPTGVFYADAEPPAPVAEPEPVAPAPRPAPPSRSTMDSDGSQSNGVGSDFSSSDGDPNGGFSSPF